MEENSMMGMTYDVDVATLAAALPDPTIVMTGNSSYYLSDTADYPLIELNLYGKSVQNGTPTPDAPVDVVSVGDDGAVEVTACGKNLLDINKLEPISDEKITTNDDNIVISAGNYIFGIRILDGNLLKVGKTYTFSVENISSYGTTSYGWRVAYADGTYSNTPNRSLILTLTITKPIRGVWLYVRTNENSTEDIVISKPQIELGTAATAYEPYTGNTATITSGLPLYSIGEYRDELIYNADGTGKIIKKTNIVYLDGSSDEYYTPGTATDVRTVFGIGNIPSTVPQSQTLCNITSDISITPDNITITTGNAINIAFGVNLHIETIADLRTWLAKNPMTIIYVLKAPQEIELTVAEIAELQKLQTYNSITNLYNDENAEMRVKVLRRDFDVKYIDWIKESQTWVCPKSGKWKVICVGGGASGGTKENPTIEGGTTSFGSIVAAHGGESTGDYLMSNNSVSGYGGYTGVNYGGIASAAFSSSTGNYAHNGGGNAILPASVSPASAIGYGAGGGAYHTSGAIPGRAGHIESTIVDIEQGRAIACTVGKGGQTADASVMASGADGVIVVQYLGF